MAESRNQTAQTVSNGAGYFRPLPESGAQFWVHVPIQRHDLHAVRSSRANQWESLDLHYRYNYKDGNTQLYLSGLNLADEAPMALDQGTGYDSWNHSAQGRVIKIGFHHRFR